MKQVSWGPQDIVIFVSHFIVNGYSLYYSLKSRQSLIFTVQGRILLLIVVLLVDFLKVWISHVSVDLCCRDITVAQHGLHRT
jgi:hypothetical protein